MEFSKQEYYGGLPCPPSGDLADPGGSDGKEVFKAIHFYAVSFPGGSDSKESPCNAGDPGSVLGLGRSPGGGHDNPL